MLTQALKQMMSTVNPNQMNVFKKLTGWWHPNGPMQILYMYNYERIKFLRKFVPHSQQVHPLSGLNILDVGCGAGFLSESMTRLGANVLGLDPNPTSFEEAKSHQSQSKDKSLQKLTYLNQSLEEYQSENSQLFDIVTSMQVIQHVDNPKQFVRQISDSTKEDGLIMLSTIRRSWNTWFTHILLAQKVTNIVPSGTHHHQKFINPKECVQLLKQNGIETLEILELDLNWKGEFQRRQGGGNYLVMGKKVKDIEKKIRLQQKQN